MTYISASENLQSKVERLFARPFGASKSVENCFSRLELQINKNQIIQKDMFVEFSFNDSGYLETVEDNAGNVEEYIYDDAGRVVNTRTNNDVNSDFKIDYDENNNPILITPAEEQEHSFEYDLIDKVKTYKSPKVGDENNVTSYDYNQDGQSVSTTTPDTKRIEYNYNDVTARLESVNYVAPQPPEGGVDTQVKIINYVYDTEKDQLTSVNLDNSTLSYEVLVSVVNPEIYPKLAELQYDGGLLLSESSSDYNSKLEWIYDDDLRVKSIKLTTNGDISSASMSDYGYNDDNQLISAEDMTYTYDNNGFLIEKRMLSGAETPFSEIYNYNDYGEVISVNNGKHDFYYTYDGTGRIKTINNTQYSYCRWFKFRWYLL